MKPATEEQHKRWHCAVCNKGFDDRNSCIEHEESCAVIAKRFVRRTSCESEKA